MITEKLQLKLEPSFITAPDSLLFELEDELYPDKGSFDGAMWIWPTATVRGHITRAAELDFSPESATVRFLCDNHFDLYINGTEITATHENGAYRVELNDAASLFQKGKNRLAIRLYQSGSELRFSSGIIGTVTVCGEGQTLRIATDGKWQAWLVCNFYEECEPEGWYLEDELRQKITLTVTHLHPICHRRSCIFTRAFNIKERPFSARLTVAARGMYEARINGSPIDKSRLIPGSIQKVIEYQVFDITGNLSEGENTLTLLLGNGWLNSTSWGWIGGERPAIAAELEIIYNSGEREIIKTDSTFTVIPSPITDNDLQFGERYDARLEYAYTRGIPAQSSAAPQLPLIQQIYPPVRITEVQEPIGCKRMPSGAIIYDFGTNTSGRARLKLKNTTRGSVIRIRYSEHLKSSGEPHIGVYEDVYFPNDNEPGAPAEFAIRNLDTYVCRGDTYECYEPRFTYTGSRYVYLEGDLPDDSNITVEKLVMRTDVREVGDIVTDCDDVAVIWDTVKRSWRSNIMTGPTDCPTREKNFWNGDILCFAQTACWYTYNRDFLGTWTDVGRKIEYNVYGWDDEEYALPLVLYDYYCCRDVIEKKYPVVLELIKRREATVAEGEIFPDGKRAPYRDHKAVHNVSAEFFAALYYTYMYRGAARMASILGLNCDASDHEARFQMLRREFNRRYYIPKEADYTERCQSGIVLPVALGISPDEDVDRLMKTLHGYVVDADYHYTTGFHGASHVLGLLSEHGYAADAWRIITARSEPSLLHMISTGATTTTENWYGHREYDDIRQYDSMNHYAFGSAARWFFEYLGGIRILEAGMKAVRLKPIFIRQIHDLYAKYDTGDGIIGSRITYREDMGGFDWTVTLPEGTRGEICLPCERSVTVIGGTHNYFINKNDLEEI